MQILCINPQDIIANSKREIDENHILQTIRFGDSVPEFRLEAIINAACSRGLKGEPVDLTEAFSYSWEWLTNEMVWTELEEIFRVRSFSKTIDGEDIVEVEYINQRDLTIEESVDVTKRIITQYIEDLRARTSIVLTAGKDERYLSPYTRYRLDNKEYDVDGIPYIVETLFYPKVENVDALSGKTSCNEGGMRIKVKKRIRDIQICQLEKSVLITVGTGIYWSCLINGKYEGISYQLRDRTSRFDKHLRVIIRSVAGKTNKIKDPEISEFEKVTNSLVAPSIIDPLYDLLCSKVQYVEKSPGWKPNPNEVAIPELGGWNDDSAQNREEDWKKFRELFVASTFAQDGTSSTLKP